MTQRRMDTVALLQQRISVCCEVLFLIFAVDDKLLIKKSYLEVKEKNL